MSMTGIVSRMGVFILDKFLPYVYTILMKRIDITITELQIKKLKAISKKQGLTVSEQIRRAIDKYFEEMKP